MRNCSRPSPFYLFIFLLVNFVFFAAMFHPGAISKGTSQIISLDITQKPRELVIIKGTGSGTRSRLESSTIILASSRKGDESISNSKKDDSLTLAINSIKSLIKGSSSNSRNSQSSYSLYYKELNERRSRGYLDSIPLRYLVEQTNFLRTPKSPCTSEMRMIVLVSSACRNEKRREAIRDTWGSNSVKLKVPVLFFVGQCANATRELEIFHDVVEVDFVDSYYNNTLKSLARLRWYNEQCSSSELLLMLDDDVIVNVDHMLKYLPSPLMYSIVCRMHSRSVPVHEKNSKWYVPEWLVRDAIYPAYCFGSSYVVNGSVVLELHKASLELPYTSIDDAIFTGYAADMIGLSKVHDDRFMVTRDKDMRCDEKAVFAAHSYREEDTRTYWWNRTEKCQA